MPSPKAPSQRVLANRQARIQMHRDTLDAMVLGMADGLGQLGLAIMEDASAHAPRDPARAAKRGVPMMAETWFVQTWALGKRTGGFQGQSLQQWQGKPRGASTPGRQAVIIIGFRSPLSHFAELGTIKERARPFFLPAVNRGVPGAEKYVLPAIARRVAISGTGEVGDAVGAANYAKRYGGSGG